MKPFTLFGREPALWLSLISSAIMVISAFFFPLSIDQQGLLNACCVSLFGVITGLSATHDGLSAAILGFTKAILALAIAFNISLSPEKQSVIMVFVSAVTAMFVRTQMTPPPSKLHEKN